MKQTKKARPSVPLTMPRGSNTLLLLQLLTVLTYSILASSLVNFATYNLKLSATQAGAILASFITFHLITHVLTGYLGGRYFSFRCLLVIGTSLQILACIAFNWTALEVFYWTLPALALASGINLTTINCLITQIFKPEDKRRENAFLWNYSLLCLGFFVGIMLSKTLRVQTNYQLLFSICNLINLCTLLVLTLNWRKLNDRSTSILSLTKTKARNMFLLGCCILLPIFILWRLLIVNYNFNSAAVIIVAALIVITIIRLAWQQPTQQARNKVFVYFILMIIALLYWVITLLVPMGLLVFVEHNVESHLLGVVLPTRWINNVHIIIIIIFGPLLGFIFFRLRHRGIRIEISLQFIIGLLLAGTALMLLPLSIHFAGANGYVSSKWIIISYILQALGQLFIQPIGLAMIGQLAPIAQQGLFMGFWMMLIGIATLIADHFSSWIHNQSQLLDPLASNQHYAQVFNVLAWCTIGLAIGLIVLLPVLNKLIHYRSLNPALNGK